MTIRARRIQMNTENKRVTHAEYGSIASWKKTNLNL